VGLWLLAGISLLASLAFVGMRLLGPSDDAAIGFYDGAWAHDGVRIEASGEPRSNLRSGDVVVAVSGRPLAEWLGAAWNPDLDRRAIAEGTAVAYTVRRDGALEEVPVTLRQQDYLFVLEANWSMIVFVFVFLAIAAYVLWRRPRASAAAALMVAASAVTASAMPWVLGLRVSDIVLGWPFLLHAFATGGLYMLLWPAGAIHLTLALSDRERPPKRGVIAVAYALPLGAYIAALLASAFLAPTTIAWIGSWSYAQLLIIAPTLVIGVGLAARAYHTARPEVRRQIRWAALGAGAAGVAFLVFFVGPDLLIGRPLVPWSALGLFALPFPVGIAASILRHRLFDIEVVVNRALVYGGLTLAVLATYVGVVTVLGTFLGVGEGFGVSLLATGMAALVALPVRDLLQRSVNRLMYGDRDDPYRALMRLGQQLEATLDPIEGPSAIVRTVADSLRVPWAGLRLGPPQGGGRLFEYGRQAGGVVHDVPLLFGAEVVGHLLVAQRGPSEPLSPADRALLNALARQAGPAVHALSLTFELVDSRQRIVAAREEERRRIRRDLHDGLGPTLAAIGMRAEVAAELATRDPGSAEEMLVELRTETQGALGEIRRLVDALRPPALDELGLVGAVAQQAERLGGSLDIRVHTPARIPELPAAVEVAAYRIAAEAMTNAVRHSGADRCDVTLHLNDDGRGRVLALDVVDDGHGLPERLEPGVGLRSMRERAAEVAGTLELMSDTPHGTRVSARLPLDQRASQGARA
jgi:signal transduction histidine kinase